MSARYYALVAGGLPGIAGLAHLYKDDSVCHISVLFCYLKQANKHMAVIAQCNSTKCSYLAGLSDSQAC